MQEVVNTYYEIGNKRKHVVPPNFQIPVGKESIITCKHASMIICILHINTVINFSSTMYLKFVFSLLLLHVSSSFCWKNFPNGYFGHFGPCILIFVTVRNTFEDADLTENLIHANNPNKLVFTVTSRFNFSDPILLDEKNALDFTFYEICTVTVFVNFALKDNTFRIFYSTYTRDAHRGRDHATFLLICKQHPEKVISLRYVTDLQGSYRTFVLHLKQDGQNSQSAEIEWFFICFYCTNIYHMVR